MLVRESKHVSVGKHEGESLTRLAHAIAADQEVMSTRMELQFGMAKNLTVADCDAEVFDCDLCGSIFLFLCVETALLCGHIQDCFLGDDHRSKSMYGWIRRRDNMRDMLRFCVSGNMEICMNVGLFLAWSLYKAPQRK